MMNDEVNANGKWINLEVGDLSDTRFVDWHKYNKHVTHVVTATVEKYGIDTKAEPYVIKIARNPNDSLFTPALNKARDTLQKLASKTPRENAGVIFNSIVDAGIPLKGQVSIFLSNTGAPIYNFTTHDELGFIVKPYVEYKKGARVMNGILASLTTITRYANIDLEVVGAGEYFYILHVMEDGKAVHGIELSYDPPVFNNRLGREVGPIRLSSAPLVNVKTHRSVGLFNELFKMFDGYDYISDIGYYELY